MISQRLLTVYLGIGIFTSPGSLRGTFYIGELILYLVPDSDNLNHSRSTDEQGWILWQNSSFMKKVVIGSDKFFFSKCFNILGTQAYLS